MNALSKVYILYSNSLSNFNSHEFFSTKEKALKALKEKAEKLRCKWGTHSLEYHRNKNNEINRFTICFGGWMEQKTTWSIAEKQVY